MSATSIQDGPPHVHVFGDLAELQLILDRQDLPDHVDPQLAPYRKLRGFVRRLAAGGAWSLTSFVRASLRDVWKIIPGFSVDAWWTTVRPPSKHWLSWLTSEEWINSKSTTVCNWVTDWTVGELKGKAHLNSHDSSPPFHFPRAIKDMTIEHASTDLEASIKSQYCDFDESTAILGQLTYGQEQEPVTGFQGMRSQVTPSWGMSIWPIGKQIKIAIRFEPRIHTHKSFQELWAHLETTPSQFMTDAWPPLKTFLEGEKDAKSESRAVLLVDPKWESLPPTSPVGYLVVSATGSWKPWMAGCRVLTSSKASDGIVLQRAELRLQPTRLTTSLSFVGFPVSATLVNLLKPEKRPVDTIARPLAVVTTVKTVETDGYMETKEVDPLQAVWNMAEYGKGDKKTFRLTESRGYDLSPAWVQKTSKQFKEWRKTHPPVAMDEKYDTDEQKLTRAVEWGLSRFHQHGDYLPQWFPNEGLDPEDSAVTRLYKHLVMLDLNFGFRRHPLQEMLAKHGVTVSQLFWKHLIDRLCEIQGISTGLIHPGDSNQNESDDDGLNDDESDDDESDDDESDDEETDVGSSEEEDFEQRKDSPKSFPDWWLPLIEWARHSFSPVLPEALHVQGHDHRLKPSTPPPEDHPGPKFGFNPSELGWIVAILGRQLPLSESNPCQDDHQWDRNDLWDLLLNLQIGTVAKNDDQAECRWLFRDRTILIISGQLLRASGAKISHRLSWEHTALDCVRELEDNPRFRPLTQFQHVVVRFGCSGAVYIERARGSDGRDVISKSLFFDATASAGFFRDPKEEGRVLGNNSVFASRILQSLLESHGAKSHKPSSQIKDAVRQAIIDCQVLHKNGYGTAFNEDHGSTFPTIHPFNVLFSPTPLFS